VPDALRVVSVTVDHEVEAMLSQASMRMGMLALPLRVKANSPEVKRGGVAELKAGFQRTAGRPSKGEAQSSVSGR